MKWKPSEVSQEALELGIELAQQEIEPDPTEGAERDESIPDSAKVYVDPRLIGYSLSSHPSLASSDLISVFDDWLQTALDNCGCDDLPEMLTFYRDGARRFVEDDAIYLFILEAWENNVLSDLPPIAVRQTGTILDGWHRIVVAVSRGQTTDIPAIVVRW